MNPLRQEVAAGVLGIDEVEVGDVVNKSPIGLLGNVLVEAAVAGFHVIDGNVHALGHHCGNAAVRVAQHEDGIGLLGLEDLLRLDQGFAQHMTQR